LLQTVIFLLPQQVLLLSNPYPRGGEILPLGANLNNMKKLLLATLLIGMMGGCSWTSTKKIDGCEYVKTYSFGSETTTLIHKGNCSNLIHKGGNK